MIMTYLLGPSIGPTAHHYLDSNWKINRLFYQRPLAAMALCDWQLRPKVIAGEHGFGGAGRTPEEGCRPGTLIL